MGKASTPMLERLTRQHSHAGIRLFFNLLSAVLDCESLSRYRYPVISSANQSPKHQNQSQVRLDRRSFQQGLPYCREGDLFFRDMHQFCNRFATLCYNNFFVCGLDLFKNFKTVRSKFCSIYFHLDHPLVVAYTSTCTLCES